MLELRTRRPLLCRLIPPVIFMPPKDPDLDRRRPHRASGGRNPALVDRGGRRSRARRDAARPLRRTGRPPKRRSPRRPRRAAPRRGSSRPPPRPTRPGARPALGGRRAKASTNCATLLEKFDGCGLKATATQLVFADGAPDARDHAGRRGAGRPTRTDSGARSSAAPANCSTACWPRSGSIGRKVYIANVVPWRPPGNRTPTLQETAICLPFIRRQIATRRAAIAGLPWRIVRADPARAQGGDHAHARAMVRLSELDGVAIKALPMLHPAYLLRQPAQKARRLARSAHPGAGGARDRLTAQSRVEAARPPPRRSRRLAQPSRSIRSAR